VTGPLPARAPGPSAPGGRRTTHVLPGAGLLQGLGVTLKAMLSRSVTQHYPEVLPELPPRSRGVIGLVEENCTSCMLCARECPDWCIFIDSHKETAPAETPGGRERTYNVLDRFAIDFSLCMYCSICIEVCPFDALYWSPEFEYAEFDIADLLHEKGRLGEWMQTVPPPPALDARSAPAKEVEAAEKAALRSAQQQGGATAVAAKPPRPAPAQPLATAATASDAPAAVEEVAERPTAPAQIPVSDSAQQSAEAAERSADAAGAGGSGPTGGTVRDGGAEPGTGS
jgi:NADH-quinone oxidoreductase subunit I